MAPEQKMDKMLQLDGLPAEGLEALILSLTETEVLIRSNTIARQQPQHSALLRQRGDAAHAQRVCKQSRFVTRYMVITAPHLRPARERQTRLLHMASTAPNKVDRHLTTPFLLKVFYKVNSFHRLDDFRATAQPSSFVEVYTWKDCSLSELATLLLSALPSLATSATKCSFRLIYADTKTSRFTSSEIGNIILPLPKPATTNGNGAGSSGGNNGSSDKVSLDEVRFVVGDWIDVAIMTGSATSSAASNGIRIRGRGGSGLTGGMPQGEWRKGDRLDDDTPTRNESNSSNARDGGRRFGGGGGGGGSGSHGSGRRGSRW
ncbi:hypothetical protein TWF696_005156 [Orbilia brochopaga]|uniref:Uncharacterized protein n=1 Tax=Orbilia brochopaga TaxID=3140254 RepID=A0AAV9V1I7_9PEZI